jgi:hypothetical protein
MAAISPEPNARSNRGGYSRETTSIEVAAIRLGIGRATEYRLAASGRFPVPVLRRPAVRRAGCRAGPRARRRAARRTVSAGDERQHVNRRDYPACAESIARYKRGVRVSLDHRSPATHRSDTGTRTKAGGERLAA